MDTFELKWREFSDGTKAIGIVWTETCRNDGKFTWDFSVAFLKNVWILNTFLINVCPKIQKVLMFENLINVCNIKYFKYFFNVSNI